MEFKRSSSRNGRAEIMITFNSRVALAGICGAACLLAAGAVCAQDPGKPLRIVQGFAPGGGHDTVARLLAPRTGKELGVQVIVEARPGANGMSGAEAVSKSAPD